MARRAARAVEEYSAVIELYKRHTREVGKMAKVLEAMKSTDT